MATGHIDKNGSILSVGDTVRYGKGLDSSTGEILILEDWSHLSTPSLPAAFQTDFGCYVSGIGYWGDCKAVPASLLEKV